MSSTLPQQSVAADEHPSSFEWVVTNISSEFVNLTSGEIDDGITRALASIGEYCHVDQTYVCLIRDDGKTYDLNFEWTAAGINSERKTFQGVPLKRFPYFWDHIRQRKVFYIPEIEQLPDRALAERQLWQDLGIMSLISVPMVTHGKLTGFMGVTAKRERMEFSDDVISLLQVAAQIFSNALDRQRMEESIRSSETRLRRVVDSNMLGILFWNAAGKITAANEALLSLLGFSPDDVAAGRLTLRNTSPAEFHESDKKYLDQIAAKGVCAPREKELLRADGSRVPVLVGGASVEPDGGGVGFVLDMSERKSTEAALRQSEERFRTLAQNVPGAVYMCRNDARYTMLYLNRAVQDLTGYSPDAFLKGEISFVELYHPDDAASIRREVNQALAERRPFHLQYRLKRADDQWRWVEEHGQGVFATDGQLQYLEGAVFDISDRKTAEDSLRAAHQGLERRVDERTEELRAANELLLSEVAVRRKMESALHNEKQFLKKTLDQHEADRRLTAYEIHDGLAQYVAGALMHFEAASRDYETNEQFELGLQLLRRTIDEARRLISGLRPPILDEQGLVAAIEYLINEHADMVGRVEFEVRQPFARLSPLLESTLFRIVQEALNNIARHAGTEAKTRITLRRDDDRVHLEVRDWGEGFDNTDVSSKAHGLRGIRERARLMGGNAAIHSKLGAGTLVVVEIPEQEDPYMRIPLHGPKK